jgi:hypothetical protein
LYIVGALLAAGTKADLHADSMFASADASGGKQRLIEFTDLEKLKEAAANCQNGTITFAWASKLQDAEHDILLEQSSSSDFSKAVTRYQGSDLGSVISGLPEGEHYFRVRHPDFPVATASSIIKVNVVFFPRAKLDWLLGVGAIVVIATMGAVVYGFRKTAKQVSLDTDQKGDEHGH